MVVNHSVEHSVDSPGINGTNRHELRQPWTFLGLMFGLIGDRVCARINEEQLADLFAEMGSALWHSQAVEHTLHIYVALKDRIRERNRVDANEAEVIIADVLKMTLGRTLRISDTGGVLTVATQERAVRFAAERNWLVHCSAAEHDFRLVLDGRYWALRVRIRSHIQEAQDLNRAIAQELEDFVVSRGVSRSWIAEQAARTWREQSREQA